MLSGDARPLVLAAALGGTLIAGLSTNPTVAASAAGVTGLSLLVLGRKRLRAELMSILIAASLAAFAAYQAHGALAAMGASSPPLYDLTQEPLADAAEGIVEVRGYLRTEKVLSEYAVAADTLPDQGKDSPYVLVPLVASSEPVVELSDHRILIARIHRSRLEGPTLATLRGRLEPLAPEVFEVLILVDTRIAAAKAGEAKAEVRGLGVLLNTVDLPSPRDAMLKLGLAVLALLLCGLAWGPGGQAAESARTTD